MHGLGTYGRDHHKIGYTACNIIMPAKQTQQLKSEPSMSLLCLFVAHSSLVLRLRLWLCNLHLSIRTYSRHERHFRSRLIRRVIIRILIQESAMET
mmetsp:Transcript_25695/g.58817  ORF Transcript_25695/g.58817 Transcript_25695/m.58817 type:complete len:96 (-) Transcript_25695:96-383(-)